ncbi:AAA family ATPase [Sporosarcina sp. Marseille-Q4063]|uniref:ParA family protein n=1 Tax=Sporosarcina sp. Marseille-Q4063 TaxID=2810514 RepID=UPI001BAEA97D|nr:ParA family protein [Sporosarcina sp. Marseille-Q4063]QUW21361.1 AAA family ATPase [Sporosarcina sp. Marseille-Q4063]
MSNVISFLNMKGGVGKTTLCKEIGFYLSKNNKKVLLIDVDPQGNLTQSIFEKFNYKHHYETDNEINYKYTVCTSTINKVFEYTSLVDSLKEEECILELNDTLSIIPGDLNTVFFERSNGGSEKENAIKNFIEDFQLKDKYDYILMDCPPTYSFYTTAALLASDFYLSPIHPDSYSILGIDLLFQVVDRLKKVHRDRFKITPLEHLGVIFTNIPREASISTGMRRMIQDIKESSTLNSLEVIFFNEYFHNNPEFPKRIDYFIEDSRSDYSYKNLRTIVKEFDEKINSFKPEESGVR